MFKNASVRQYAPAVIAVLAVGAILLLMGREPICKCGYIKFWHGTVVSSENSQHITDWYSFSHVIHGLLFYFVGWLLFPKLSFATRLLIATLVEGGWEIFENTSYVINHYREVTISRDYYGDSVLNSICDILAMILGFVLARKLPVLASVAFALALELGVAYFIRDNLTLNIIMFIYPQQWIVDWQAGT